MSLSPYLKIQMSMIIIYDSLFMDSFAKNDQIIQIKTFDLKL